MDRLSVSIQEDVFFYIDLSKEHIKIKNIIKNIEDYIEQKRKINDQGYFGVLVFQEEGNPIFISEQETPEEIISIIEDNWKDRAKEQSYFENGLFYIFSHIAEGVRKKSKFNRIIVLTDTPSDLNEEYQDALFNLVSKIKYFPTFIDIIRISEENQRFFKDDVKLNILASDTRGGIFYVKNKKELKDVFKKLLKNKQLIDTFTDKPNQLEVDKEMYLYYNNLAKDLVLHHGSDKVCYFCQDKICPICMEEKDIPKECPDCGEAYHNHCAVNYTINNNIGIPHIWRCPQCDTLLKVDEDEFIQIEDVNIDISVQDYLGEKTEYDSYKNQSSYEKYGIEYNGTKNLKKIKPPEKLVLPSNDVQKKQKKITQEVKSEQHNGVKQVKIGGFFGSVYSVKKFDDKILYDKNSLPSLNEDEKVRQKEKITNNKDVTQSSNNNKKSNYWMPPNGEEENSLNNQIKICPICGKLLTSDVNNFCVHCGSKLK